MVINAELGTKRNCPSCASRFYDLNNDPINCPHCGETFIVEPILPSKAGSPAAAAPVRAPQAEAAKPPVPEPTADDDDDKANDADDETAGIKDVDLGEDAEVVAAEGDNTFLETDDDDETNVTDIVAPGPKAGEET